MQSQYLISYMNYEVRSGTDMWPCFNSKSHWCKGTTIICSTEDICLKSQINLLKVKTCITINSCYYLDLYGSSFSPSIYTFGLHSNVVSTLVSWSQYWPFHALPWKMAKNTFKILRCGHRKKIFEICLTILQHYTWSLKSLGKQETY